MHNPQVIPSSVKSKAPTTQIMKLPIVTFLFSPLFHLSALAAVRSPLQGIGASSSCRNLPGDAQWPSQDAWQSFNKSVGGRLIATMPLGSACHDPGFDGKKCLALRRDWSDPRIHLSHPSSIMQMSFTNLSCDVFTPRQNTCQLGNYPVYTVNVSSTSEVSKTIKFARRANIRVNIRNTGHDLLGRSTAPGSLSIWTHHLSTTTVIPSYSCPSYSGPAIHFQPGVLGSHAIQTAHQHRLVVLTGSCPSVGLAGGYIQGGGHSILSTAFGLAADQVLEYEVVVADGRVVRATVEENSDLYWALSGGGGGTFGVVVGVIVRAYRAGMIGGGRVVVQANATSLVKIGRVVGKLHEALPGMVDGGATVNYLLSRKALSIGPFTVVNSTGEYVRDVVAKPVLDHLRALRIPFKSEFSTLSYRDHYDKWLGPLPWGNLRSSDWQYGSRLVPRSSLEKNHTEFSTTLFNLTSHVGMLVGTAGNFNPPHKVDNAVNPIWRSSILQLQVLTPWKSGPEAWPMMMQSQHRMTKEFLPQIKAVSPGGGAYMNEADFQEVNWREEWYGKNWERLNRVKRKWDPSGLFYVFKGVGSDALTVDEGGRMCIAENGVHGRV